MSALSNLLPLILLFLFVAGGAFIGYQIYVWSQEMADRGVKKMEKKHMTFTKEGGLKVGVKEVKDEKYTDKTQNVLVNVWNTSGVGSKSSTPRPSVSRTSSNQAQQAQPRVASSSGAAANLSPPTARSGARRSASPVPGSFD